MNNPDFENAQHILDQQAAQQRAMTQAIEDGIKATWTPTQLANYNAERGCSGVFGMIYFGIVAGLCFVWNWVATRWAVVLGDWTLAGIPSNEAAAWASVIIIVWVGWPIIRGIMSFNNWAMNRCRQR